MELNKKGVFFTFAAIALSIIIILSVNVYNEYRLNDKMEVIEIRIDTMNNFIKNMENDIEEVIFIVGFRSLLSLEDYMMMHDQFFNEIDTPPLNVAFSDTFLLGKIDRPGGGKQRMDMMINNTFLTWLKRLQQEANKTDIELEFNIDSVTISQSDPWIVNITVQMDIVVEDEKNTASWTINNKVYTGQINITTDPTSLPDEKRFVDPLYLVYNDGLVNNTFRVTTVTDFSTQLPEHLTKSYYREHSDAPSYLNRFNADTKFTASANGIESLVNSQKIIDLEGMGELPPGTSKDKTAVDYIYYDSTNNPDDDLIESMEVTYPWFYLDYSSPTCDPTSGHVLFYERICYIP